MPDLQGLMNSVYDPVENALRVTSVAEAFFYAPGEVTPMQNAAAVLPVVTNGVPRLSMPDGATMSSVGITFAPPKWWSTFEVAVAWVPEVATGGNVRFVVTVKKFAIGADILSEAAFATGTADVAAGTTAIQVKYNTGIIAPVNATPDFFGTLYSIELARDSNHANDTLAGAIGLLNLVPRRIG